MGHWRRQLHPSLQGQLSLPDGLTGGVSCKIPLPRSSVRLSFTLPLSNDLLLQEFLAPLVPVRRPLQRANIEAGRLRNNLRLSGLLNL